jgi:N-acetylglutamate synthase-like GNAT family acetyltransferase
MKDPKEREKFEEVYEQHVLSAHYDEAHDEQPIAYMVLEVRTYEDSKFMYIRWLIGHPEKGGGGSQLVNEAIARFKKSGLSELRVDSAFSAVGWYESLGFQKVVPEKSVAKKGVGYADTELVYRSE